MRYIVKLLDRFRQDEGGAFALIFAVMAIVLVAMGGAAVDYTSIQQSRTRTQVALDAAALALEPTIYTATSGTIQSQAEALLISQLADGVTTWGNCSINSNVAPCVAVSTPVMDTTQGQLTLTATLKIPMTFVSLVGVTTMPAVIVSVATRKKLALEVAMVIDNSNSMSYTMGYNKVLSPNPTNIKTRMGVTIDSARCAMNILFYSVADCSTTPTGTANAGVKIGLVPFTMEVNVGAAAATAGGWLDTTGTTGTDSIDLDNFDSDDNPTNTYAGPVNRLSLFNKVKNPNTGSAVPWGGCVEARKAPYDTDDTLPTSGDTLFTPYFAPDEPDTSGGFNNNYLSDAPSACTVAVPSCSQVLTKTNCNTGTYDSCSRTATASYTLTVNGTTTHPTSCSFVTDLIASTGSNPNPTDASSGSGSTRTDTRTTKYGSNRARQQRICKYGTTGTVTMTSKPVQGSVFGPNGDCPANAITPLTDTPATVLAGITAMAPQGGTNITEGAAWGFRVLSPTAPFSEGTDYSTATSKVLIIMTDGANTSYAGQTPDVAGTTPNMNGDVYYSAYGYPWNNDKTNTGTPQRNRLGAMGWPDVSTSGGNSLESVMNTRLASVCTNAKTAGITVYTIGVDTVDSVPPTTNITVAQAAALSAANKTLLTNCATPTGDDGKLHYFFPDTVSDLQDAFVNIAQQLGNLRLAQ